MVDLKKKNVLNGCIKTTKGPWKGHKTTKDGTKMTRYRFPSENERQRNKEWEQKRRVVAKNIFSGLRKHGNYKLPEHADNNDLLKALCAETGWHVDEDGTIYKKQDFMSGFPSLISIELPSLSPVPVAIEDQVGGDKIIVLAMITWFQLKSLKKRDFNLSLSLASSSNNLA